MNEPSPVTRNYNTNNAWGFGGSHGVEWEFSSGWKLRRGTISYRHPRKGLPTVAFYAVHPNGYSRILDLHDGEHSKWECIPAEVREFAYAHPQLRRLMPNS